MNTQLLGGECSEFGAPDKPDYFQIVGWSLVATGFIYYAWRAFA